MFDGVKCVKVEMKCEYFVQQLNHRIYIYIVNEGNGVCGKYAQYVLVHIAGHSYGIQQGQILNPQ